MRATIIPLVMGLLTGVSCSEKETMDRGEYLVFGEFYGFCVGERCIEIFKLENGRLYEDTTDQYPDRQDLYEGQYVLLDEGLYDKVAFLKNAIPLQLLQETDTVIGQPDAGDWGGFYLEKRVDGDRRFWLIDKKADNIPAYLYNLTQKLDSAIHLISDK